MVNNRDKILDISVNLARLSDWILSENEQKQKRVDQFLQETQGFLLDINPDDVSSRFQSTFYLFHKEFEKLRKTKNTANKIEWAEKALTWSNILQHRAKLV